MKESLDVGAGIDRLKASFNEVIADYPGGASISIWRDGKCLLSLQGGEASPGKPWMRNTPCLIWSAGKGIASACTLYALQEHDITLNQRVADIWPEFGAEGKDRITFAEILSHRAGLAAIDRKGFSITDHEGVIGALSAQRPNWIPDGSHGYGARTFGFLLEEVVRRLTGETLSSYWDKTFRIPLHLDLWFGLPSSCLEMAAEVIAPKTPPAPSPFTRAFSDSSSLTRRALNEPGGPITPTAMNSPTLRMASIPSLGVISTADALAHFYSLLTGNSTQFTPSTRLLMQTTLSKGLDRVLMEKTSFSAGFMSNEYGVYGPSTSAFGHPGAGGALGFADPDSGLGFAFIPSGMTPGALPGPRTRRLVSALYGMPKTE